MINMERRELRDSKQVRMQEGNNSISMQMISLINSLGVAVVISSSVVDMASNISNSILVSMASSMDTSSNSSMLKTSLIILMSLS